MKTIEILGTGCAKCRALAAAVEQAAHDAGIEFRLVKVEDIERILGYGVMATPAIVVDGVVKAAGRIPSVAELRAYLS